MEHTTTAPDASIAAFAAAVRASLDDLPADEVDELVEGLESDLIDQAFDRGDEFALGDPDAYASELRAAAGIPPRTEAVVDRRKPSELAAEWVSTQWRSAVERMRRNAAAAWVIDLLVALRPVWWLARGWAIYAVIAPIFGVGFLTPRMDALSTNPVGGVVLALFVVISVQWGRNRWVPRQWVRVLRVVTSIFAVIALPVLVSLTIWSASVEWQRYQEPYIQDMTVSGLAVDGERVRNIFAYDSEGNPITDVQLFDQNGRPLTTVGGSADPMTPWDYYFEGGGGPVPVAFTTPGREPQWNIFPLRELSPAVSWDEAVDPSEAELPDFPFVQVPAVGGSSSSAPSPSPSQSPPATPETSPAPAP